MMLRHHQVHDQIQSSTCLLQNCPGSMIQNYLGWPLANCTKFISNIIPKYISIIMNWEHYQHRFTAHLEVVLLAWCPLATCNYLHPCWQWQTLPCDMAMIWWLYRSQERFALYRMRWLSWILANMSKGPHPKVATIRPHQIILWRFMNDYRQQNTHS